MAEDTVKLRATVPVWDAVGIGAQKADHYGLGSGDVVDVPREHAQHLLRQGGYVMATEPVMVQHLRVPMVLIKHKSDPFCTPGAAEPLGDGTFLIPADQADAYSDHGFELVKDERGRPVPVNAAPDPRDIAAAKATDALAGMTATLSSRDREIAQMSARIAELDSALSAAAETNVGMQAQIDELMAEPKAEKTGK